MLECLVVGVVQVEGGLCVWEKRCFLVVEMDGFILCEMQVCLDSLTAKFTSRRPSRACQWCDDNGMSRSSRQQDVKVELTTEPEHCSSLH